MEFIPVKPTQADMYENFFYRLIHESSFVYALTKYSTYSEIEDPEFHNLKNNLIKAMREMVDYALPKAKESEHYNEDYDILFNLKMSDDVEHNQDR